MNWSRVLAWAVSHTDDVPAFVSLVLTAVRAEGFVARVKAIGALYEALQEILADFPLPTDVTYRAELVNWEGVSEADKADFLAAMEA